MGTMLLKWGYLLLVSAAPPCCLAQETATPVRDDAQEADAGACCRIADGTTVTLEILQPLNSALAKRGDKFRLRLTEPVLIEGNAVLVPGIEGVGEIVHAEKSRGGGKAGELLIAARYLEYPGTQVPLRGLKLGGKGKDNTTAAMATAIALGPLAHFVHGREIVIPAGTLVQAKIAQELQLAPRPDLRASAPATFATESAIPAADQNPGSAPSSLLPAEPIAEGTATQSTVTESTQEPKE
ncbi:MAG: hypothetical protein ACREO0_15395 [Pseudoxanthomonas sp.]